MRAQKIRSSDRNPFLAIFSLLFGLVVSGPVRSAGLEYDFLAAKEAYAAGDAASLAAHSSSILKSPLAPYAEFWQAALALPGDDPRPVEDFLDKYRGTLLAERMRNAWLKHLAKTAQWQLFLDQYPKLESSDPGLFCSSLQARNALGDGKAYGEAKPMWMSATPLPQSCQPIFESLLASGEISTGAVRKRLRLILESGNITLATEVNDDLPANERLSARLLRAAYSNPYRYLKTPRLSTRPEREIALFAVLRIAREDPVQAKTYWSEISSRYGAADRSYLLARIAFRAALNHMPEALSWFDEAGGPQSAEEDQWEIREALRLKDWNRVLEGIDSLPPQVQSEETWQYWKARALEEKGRGAEANAILAVLSHQRDFYGQLALEEMGTVITLPGNAYRPSRKEIEAVRNLPGIQRSLLLYSMGLRYFATREWIWAVRNFDDRELISAAELAKREGLYDRAINTAEKAKTIEDFDLRFLAPYRDIMHEQTKLLDLDEAWVYGLIRQESRFVTAAKSGVGASGLMQLMPATASWVARKMGLRNYRSSIVSELETNISLGTYYLKHVLGELGNQPVLASAAYNAGPSRARKWLDQNPMEGAIYIESIPFGETRDYVKKVMSNTEYYAISFGQESRTLKERLGMLKRSDAGQLEGP